MRVRRLGELRAAGDERWFRPALDRLAGRTDDGAPPGFLATDRPSFVARAPGRLDVMGGIADYSGALVLQLPLDRATTAIAQRQEVSRCDVLTRRDGRWHQASVDVERLLRGDLRDAAALARWYGGRPDERWAAYAMGVVQHALRRTDAGGTDAVPSVRLLVDSTVPEGKGVSSSAALEVACMAATLACLGMTTSCEELAASCQWVENHAVGAPCGIMDQTTSACGRAGRLLRLRCQPGTVEGHVAIPEGWRVVGVDSWIRHAVTGADYGTVRTAAFMGYRILADAAGLTATPLPDGRVRVDDERWHGHLANVDAAEFDACLAPLLPERLRGADFLARWQGTTDPATRVDPARDYPVRDATAHPVHEQRRVERFAALLAELPARPDAAHELGALMYASHASYGRCGLGSDGTDRLVALAAEAGPARGVYGAKITGGGSGGTVALLVSDDAEPAVHELAARYAAETGREAELFTTSGPGAEEVGVVRVEAGEWDSPSS